MSADAPDTKISPVFSRLLKHDFDLGDVLSVTTGKLVTPRLMDSVYDVMGFVSGDPEIATIGVPMMIDQVRASILEQHPQLAGITAPPRPEGLEQEKIADFYFKWVDDQKEVLGDKISLTPMPVPMSISQEDQIEYISARNQNAIIRAISADGEMITPPQPGRKPAAPNKKINKKGGPNI